MRGVLRVGVAASTCVLAVACGSNDEPSFGATVSAAKGTGAVLDSTQLTARMLGGSDLPGDFTAMPPRSTDASTSPVPESALTNPADCARLLTTIAKQWPGASGTASVQFAGPSYATIDVDMASYQDAALTPAFDALQAQPRRCGKYSSEDAGVAVDYRTEPLTLPTLPTLPTLGDASTAFVVTAKSDDMTLTSSAALAQVGNTLVQVVVTAPESIDPGVLSDVMGAQVRKLRG
ncbi:sensor domain-containing protein [Nocardia camponoti]|uniref:Sensor domain-containing protein n=1 Tax=Nocardia camponoti TaxID=1616106 RepID=A0A917QS46_9NOCA|nr:sensor domain-containing protein [Nocardia camponoti]GGK65744.1 hypothetical protein GCM10011591_42460 [Nocardia camponoti]